MTHERLDLKKIQFPKKEAKTPTKNGLPGSRPGSPEREVVSRSPTSALLSCLLLLSSFGLSGSWMGWRQRSPTLASTCKWWGPNCRCSFQSPAAIPVSLRGQRVGFDHSMLRGSYPFPIPPPSPPQRKTLDLSLQPASTQASGKTLPIPVQITLRFNLPKEREAIPGGEPDQPLSSSSCLQPNHRSTVPSAIPGTLLSSQVPPSLPSDPPFLVSFCRNGRWRWFHQQLQCPARQPQPQFFPR